MLWGSMHGRTSIGLRRHVSPARLYAVLWGAHAMYRPLNQWPHACPAVGGAAGLALSACAEVRTARCSL